MGPPAVAASDLPAGLRQLKHPPPQLCLGALASHTPNSLEEPLPKKKFCYLSGQIRAHCVHLCFVGLLGAFNVNHIFLSFKLHICKIVKKCT